MPPDPSHLLDSLGLETPPIGLYDAPDAAAFEPCVRPQPGQRTCVFAFYKEWLRGRTLHLTWEAHGCGGAARRHAHIARGKRRAQPLRARRLNGLRMIGYHGCSLSEARGRVNPARGPAARIP